MNKKDLLKLKKVILENKRRMMATAIVGSVLVSGTGCSKAVTEEGMTARDVCKSIDHTKVICPLTEEYGIEHQIEKIAEELSEGKSLSLK